MGGAPGGADLRVKDGRVKRNLLSGPKSAFAPTAASAAEARTGDPRRARSRGEGRGARAPAKARAACAMMLGRLCDRHRRRSACQVALAPKARSSFRGRRPDRESRCMLCRSRGLEGTSDYECDVDAVGEDSSRAAMNLRALLLAAVASALVALGAADEYDHKVRVPPNLAPRASRRIFRVDVADAD